MKTVLFFVQTEDDETKEEKEEEVNHLFQEATMPIEEVIAKYGAEQVSKNQCFGYVPIHLIPNRIQILMTKNLKKILERNQNYNLPFPSALKREHPELQNMKFHIFYIFVGHFCPPRSGSEYESIDLIKSGSGSE